MKYIFLILIFLILLAYAGQYDMSNIAFAADNLSSPISERSLPYYNRDEMMTLSLNPMVELDFMKKSEIYALRTKYVRQFPELAPDNYSPSDRVFGQIEDGKPWFGILGLSYYGAGDKSNAGLSEESRFIANPYLLIALADKYIWTAIDDRLKPEAIYPVPVTLRWKKDKSYAIVTYDVKRYLALARQYYGNEKRIYELGLTYYNATDFGFNYMFIDPALSQNIILSCPRDKPVELIQFIHTGGRGTLHPDGVNNKSPEQKESEIEIKGLPLRLVIKLWKQRPSSISQQADMTFEILGF